MEDTSVIKNIVIIACSFLVGMILEVIPLPHWAVWARPEWVFITLIFWVMIKPQYVGLMVAFIVGLVMDLLTSTLLGQHALAYTFVVYLAIHFRKQMENFPLRQQVIVIFVFILLELALQSWVMGLLGILPKSWGYWMPAVTSLILWPWFYIWHKEKRATVEDYL